MLRKVNVLITGRPGCGKSTLVERVISLLLTKGAKVGGITTPEFRDPTGRRGGFLIRDIATGEERKMAAIGMPSRIRVGRYGVDVEAVRSFGVTAIERAVEDADLIVIDEIGKMELAVPEFRQCVATALNSPKPVLGTIGLHLSQPFAEAIKRRPDVRVILLSPERREEVYCQVCELLGFSG